MTRIYRHRDLSILDFDTKEILIACDSCGSIGEKEADLVRTSSRITGYYEARLVLMELISQGAEPLTILNAVSNEWEPTGREIFFGIEKAVEEIGLDPKNLINGSTEENFETSMTALGITAIGVREKKTYRAKEGEVVLAMGKRLLGDDLVEDGGKSILSLKDLDRLRREDFISELLPVGSKGVLYEISNLEKESGLEAKVLETRLDLKLSCGPSTIVLATLKEENIEKLDFIGVDKEIVAKFT